MERSESHPANVVVYYWNAYFEWRSKYALEDRCMPELVAAIRAEINSGVVSSDDVPRLENLARMIEIELLNEQSANLAA